MEPVSDEDLDRVHDPLMSPLVWDLGHIAAFEDLWLCQRAGGLEPLQPELASVYDATETPRAERGDMPYLRRDDALAYMEAVRERALDVLDRDRPTDRSRRGMLVVQHEHQHNETMLQTLQLAEPGTFVARARRGRAERRPPARSTVPGGPFELGHAATGFAYDNERPRHRVDLPAFEIDRAPVTNGAYRRVRGRRRLPARGAVVGGGLGAAAPRALGAAALLDARRAGAPLRPHRASTPTCP